MNVVTRLDADVVREAGRDHWLFILASLGIEVTPRKHRPCPHCGGKDRFRFDDRDGRGTYFCNRCGAGDGFRLVEKVKSVSFPEALRIVAGVLGLTPSSRDSRRRPPPSRPRPDHLTIAFQFDLAALDLRLRAEKIVGAAQDIDVSALTDDDLDHALGHVAQAYADVERAELFEHVADTLRARAYNEGRSRERHAHVA